MRQKRDFRRLKRRLETEFSFENRTYRGITGDLSIKGLFIRTSRAFVPGTIIDIMLSLPDGSTSKLKGTVKNATKTHGLSMKNGMGIELVERDSHYLEFIKSFSSDNLDNVALEDFNPPKENTERTEEVIESSSADSLIHACPKCGVKNKFPKSKASSNLTCGKCGALLSSI